MNGSVMRMEGALAKFKISIKYVNYSFEETLEIEAENSVQATAKCEEIKEENRAIINRCKSKGIYVSKQIQDCVLCRMTLKEELQKCNEIFNSLKNDI